MTLEEKFKEYINNAQRNYDLTISPSVLIHDLAKIANENKVVIAEGKVSIENTTVFIDGLSLEQFIDAEICQRIKKYQGKNIILTLEVV